MSTKQKLIQARKAVRAKLRLLRLGYSEREQTLRETFKPVTDSLRDLSTKISHDDAITEFLNSRRDALIDRVFGVSRTKPYMLGVHPITLTDDAVHIGDRRFQRTPGLLNLILLKLTKSTTYSPEDLEVYREILQLTGVHENTQGRNSTKYRTVIKPIIIDGGSKKKKMSVGDGIDFQHKAVNNLMPQYIYYDDPNELIERLRLLMGSLASGNTAHSNEIASIISELRQREIIE